MDQTMHTPYFIIDEPVLTHYYDMLARSLSENWDNYLIGYSFKTYSLPWLVSYMKKRGAFAEVVSEDEYSLARYMGYGDHEIVYNGPYKGEQSFRAVLLAGGIVNLDSMQEVRWLKDLVADCPQQTFRVGIRANFNLEKMCPGETTMGEVSGRFGFCYETGRFQEALVLLRQIPNVAVTGLHLHSSSKSRSVNIFRSIARMACQLQEEFQLQLSYVDLGGGYCGGMEGRPEYPDYFPAIAEELRKCFTPGQTKLIVEPGISMISKCTTFVTSVFDTRDIKGTRYVMTDVRQPFQYRPDDDQVVAPVPYTVCRGPFPCGRPFCAGSFCLRRCTGLNRRYRFSSFCAPCYGASDRQRLYLHGSGPYLYPQRPARADPRRPYHLRECGRLYHEPESSFYPIFSGCVREKSECSAPGTPEMDARRVCAGLLP